MRALLIATALAFLAGCSEQTSKPEPRFIIHQSMGVGVNTYRASSISPNTSSIEFTDLDTGKYMRLYGTFSVEFITR